MKWLLNMNIPRKMKALLESIGHQCRHAGDIGLAQANDWTILNEAARENEVIMTHDLDYGRLLAFSDATKPSVVIVRLFKPHPDAIFERLKSVWDAIEQPLKEGAIVVMEDAATRIRLLPVKR